MLQIPHLPGQSDTTPGSIGQKYSVSPEIAWSRSAFGETAPGQLVPVVANHVPAADHQRGEHQHHREAEPDLDQLECRTLLAARTGPEFRSIAPAVRAPQHQRELVSSLRAAGHA